jgi:chromate reductase, NAD(P)H dehydrogenase (quinone)
MHSRNDAQVLAISGSLRRSSFNTSLLGAMAARAPDGVSISVYEDLGAIPFFNEDLEANGGPESVMRLRTAVARADAILIATPEYNQSMPGVLKNLVDWLSRSEPDVLAGKPLAIVGATAGSWGTRLAQAALRQTLTACGAFIMPAPQVYLRGAGDLFDAEGSLTDENTGKQLVSFLESFRQWISVWKWDANHIPSHP